MRKDNKAFVEIGRRVIDHRAAFERRREVYAELQTMCAHLQTLRSVLDNPEQEDLVAEEQLLEHIDHQRIKNLLTEFRDVHSQCQEALGFLREFNLSPLICTDYGRSGRYGN